MWCIVDLPDGSQRAVPLDPKALGQECLEKVCKGLGIICEMQYFGLTPWTHNQKESRTRQWYNLRNRLLGDSSSSSSGSSLQLMLALRVKFWVPVHSILQESVRNLFYMQARRDLLEGRLCAHDWNNAAKLSALLCQADGLRFNEQSLRAECPIRIRRALAQQQQQLAQQQQQQQKLEQQRKEKEHVLKKRRLSKQKSVEHIECCILSAPATIVATHSSSSSSSNNNLQPSPSASASASASASVSASASSSSSPSNSSSSSSCQSGLDERLAGNVLRMYEEYIIQPSDRDTEDREPPVDFLRQIASEHQKLAKLPMTPKAAKYWLLQAIQELSGYGEEVFSGVSTSESAARCDIAVGAHGITVIRGDEKESIPFSAIAAAKSLRRTFKLEYVDDHNDRKDLEIKLPKQPIAAGLYRSITERHAFYVCDKVRCVVTNQFTRDLKGTIASMFKEDTELGKRYVFDIQHTCREVHDQARRILHERGAMSAIDGAGVGLGIAGAGNSCASGSGSSSSNSCDPGLAELGVAGGGSMAGNIDLAIREKEAREAAIERCVDSRINEAMQCKICMDRAINTVFNPCCHVIACAQCAARCNNCPNCRAKISSVVKIYLPPELRTSQTNSSSSSSGQQTEQQQEQQPESEAEAETEQQQQQHQLEAEQLNSSASSSPTAAGETP